MAKKQVEKRPESEGIDRRKLLKNAGLAGASLVIASIAGDAFAQQKTKTMKASPAVSAQVKTLKVTPTQQTIEKVLIEAMKSKNMNTAIRKYGRNLSRAEKRALSSLTAADLAALQSIQSKLGNVGAASRVSGGLIF